MKKHTLSESVSGITPQSSSSRIAPLLRGTLYGSLLTLSLSALLAQAAGADGIFGDYFTRIIRGANSTGRCPTGEVITGFSVSTSDYGTPICSVPPSQDATPIGTIAAFNASICPAGWSPANGGNGTPDLRGEFIRGWDNGRGVDAGRVLGSWQDASKVAGAAGNPTPTYIAGDNYAYAINTTTAVPFTNHNLEGLSSPMSTSPNNWLIGFYGYASSSYATTRFGKVRPRNIALLYCMKTSGSTSSPSSNVTWTNTTGDSAGNVIQATTGNVGIGTAAPTQKLDVNGDTRINGTANISDANIGQVNTNTLCLSGDCRTAWSTTSSWPSGNYCILKAGGSCPTGFSSVAGSLTTYTYMWGNANPVSFGNSSITKIGGGCSRADGSCYATLTLAICCK